MSRSALAALVVALGLTACVYAGAPSPRQQHWLACSAYTSALESIAVRKEAGMFDAEQVAQIQLIERQTTPLCLQETPSAEGALLVNDALLSLEAFLVTQAAE